MKILSVDGKESGNRRFKYRFPSMPTAGTDYRDMSAGADSFSAQAFRDTDMKAEGPIVTRVNEIYAEKLGYMAGGPDPDSITGENPEPEIMGNISTRFHWAPAS